MYWNIRNDEEIYSGDIHLMTADSPAEAKTIVEFHNRDIDRVVAEIRRLRPEYQTQSMLDVGKRQLLDHFENFTKRDRSKMNDPTAELQAAADCLTSYLLDKTETVFEEDEQIDEARTVILNRIQEEAANG